MPKTLKDEIEAIAVELEAGHELMTTAEQLRDIAKRIPVATEAPAPEPLRDRRFAPGAPVRFLEGLYTSVVPDGSVLTDGHRVGVGDEGSYWGRHPNYDALGGHWHIITVVHEGETLYVPCHESMFEKVGEDD